MSSSCCFMVIVVQVAISPRMLGAMTDVSTMDDLFSSSCPSFCDADNYYHKPKPCPLLRFCCSFKDVYFDCCKNNSLRIKEPIKNDYNCYRNKVTEWLAAYWKVILGVCLPVGTFSVVAAVTLCSLQSIRQRQYQRRNTALADLERTRSNSAASTLSDITVGSLNQPGPRVAVTPEENALQPDIMYIELETLQPPPYTDAKPPQYTEIYPQ